MTFRFTEGTYAYNILKYLSLVVEIPYNSLYLLPGEERMYKRYVRELGKKGYISVIGSGPSKTIRLRRKSFDNIEEYVGKKYLDDYLIMSENHKFRGGESGQSQMWRKHRIAEVSLMLDAIGVEIAMHKKPELKLGEFVENKIDLSTPLFYNSREMKSIDEEQSKKVSFTRIIGILMSKGGHYSLYNINQGLIKWNNSGEQKAQILAQNIISTNTKIEGSYYQMDRSIMFGKDMNLAYEILESNGSQPDANGFELLSFDNTYPNIHYITLDENGEFQLKFMTQRRWLDRIVETIFKDQKVDPGMSAIDCDAIREYKNRDKKEAVLTFFDGNISRLRRFVNTYEFMKESMDYTIFCFPWQKEMLEKYIGDLNINVFEINPKIMDTIFGFDKEVKDAK